MAIARPSRGHRVLYFYNSWREGKKTYFQWNPLCSWLRVALIAGCVAALMSNLMLLGLVLIVCYFVFYGLYLFRNRVLLTLISTDGSSYTDSGHRYSFSHPYTIEVPTKKLRR